MSMYCSTEKMKKITDAMIKILLRDVLVLIENYKVMYFFNSLSSMLKELRVWLKNKHFITSQKSQKKKSICCDLRKNKRLGKIFRGISAIFS